MMNRSIKVMNEINVRSNQKIKKAKAEKHNLKYEANKQLEEKLQKIRRVLKEDKAV